tara:strand:- start:651 stop:3809 length:3159 start_codon:yes stop_codon:yes gene_type:complete
MPQKQKIISYLPSKKEYHIGGYNWNGAGTDVEDRISLKYKGSVGSESYFLPVNKLDLAAFQHDLLYYSPNPLTLSYADQRYLEFMRDNSIRTSPVILVSKALIAAQYNTRGAYSNLLSGVKAVDLTGKLKETVKLAVPIANYARRGGGFGLTDLLAIPSIIDGARQIPNMGEGLRNKINQFKEALSAKYYESDEWIEISKENKEVFDKYQKYLSTVGHFDKNDEFVVDSSHKLGTQHKRARATIAYTEFFDSYVNYIKWINNHYKDYAGDFKAYKIPSLNKKQLFTVSAPIQAFEPPIENIVIPEEIKKSLESDSDDINTLEENINKINTLISPNIADTVEASTKTKPTDKMPDLSAQHRQNPMRPMPVEAPDNLTQDEIKSLYDEFLKNDNPAYETLMDYGSKSTKKANQIKKFIKETYGYTSESPFAFGLIPKSKDKRVPALKKHFATVAYVKQLDKINIDPDLKLQRRDAYTEYLLKVDPKGELWYKTSGLIQYVDSTLNPRRDLKISEYRKVLGIINRRRLIIGLPKLKPENKTADAIKDVLKNTDLTVLVDLYTKNKHFTRTVIEEKKSLRVAEVEIEIKEGSPEGVMMSLTGKSAKEIVDDEFAEIMRDMVIEELMVDRDGQFAYSPKAYPTAKTGRITLASNIKKIIANTIVKGRIDTAIASLKDKKEFRQSEPESRKAAIITEIGHKPFTEKEFRKGITELNKYGFISGVRTAIRGSPSAFRATPEIMTGILKAMAHVPIERINTVKTLVDRYNTELLPELKGKFDKSVSETVGAIPSIKTLPSGVRVESVQVEADTKSAEKKRLETKVSLEGAKIRLNEIKREKKEVADDDLEDLIKEEEELMEIIKKIGTIAKTKGDPFKSTTKGAGSLRPHIKNATAKSVEKAIGETPEQQMKDFKNWYVFDIPDSSGGQGSARINPLVKQNEISMDFMGEGDIFNNFNQTYLLTEGIEDRKDFYKERPILTHGGVRRGIDKAKLKSEEADFLKGYNRGSNGLSWHQTAAAQNDFKPIYQVRTYPFQDTTNTSILTTDYDKNLNYFVNPRG